ncbi:hypothetical protein D0B54_01730 [Solimonas sp. K1W22B-7]|nr:hypothetical protein D0B54_01730 [Solimonas sp. K1W22B-7]
MSTRQLVGINVKQFILDFDGADSLFRLGIDRILALFSGESFERVSCEGFNAGIANSLDGAVDTFWK